MLDQLGINPSLLLTQAIGFLILLALFYKFALTPATKILDDRTADIKNTYDQLDRDRNAMEQARREYEQRLANIEAEAREKIQAAIKEAQALRDNLVSDAHKQAEEILEKGRDQSDRDRAKAFLEMREQLVGITVAAAGKVIGESLTDARHTKLVDDFITNVGQGTFVTGRSSSGNGAHGSAATS